MASTPITNQILLVSLMLLRANALTDNNLDDLVETEIEAGKYLTSSAEGNCHKPSRPFPEKGTFQRSRLSTYSNLLMTDFEFYKGETAVEISIAIK